MFQEAVSKKEAPRRDTGLLRNTIVRRAYPGVAGDRAELLTIKRHRRSLVPTQEAGAIRRRYAF